MILRRGQLVWNKSNLTSPIFQGVCKTKILGSTHLQLSTQILVFGLPNLGIYLIFPDDMILILVIP